MTIKEPGPAATTLHVAPPVIVTVTAEKHDSLPLFNPNAGGWAKGAQLRGVRAQETTTPYLLDPESLVLRAGPEPDSPLLRRGQDYEADLAWGTIGRCANSAIKEGQPVFASYRHARLRIDAVVLTRGGRIVLRQGEPRPAAPLPPKIEKGERRLANIWLPGRLDRLGPEHLFPVLETAYPEPPKPKPTPAEQLSAQDHEETSIRRAPAHSGLGRQCHRGHLRAGLGAQPLAGTVRGAPQGPVSAGQDRAADRGLGRTQHRQLPGRTPGQPAQLPGEGAGG